MVFDFILTLKAENNRYVNSIGAFLCLLSVWAFTMVQLSLVKKSPVLYVGIFFIIGLFIYNIFRSRIYKLPIYFSRGLIIAAIVWTKMPYFQWLVFVFFLLALLERKAKAPLVIGFSEELIVFNSLIKRKYHWNQFSQVILNKGLLTLDFKNNKLLQKEIADEEENEATEEEFNAFCQQQLKAQDFSG